MVPEAVETALSVRALSNGMVIGYEKVIFTVTVLPASVFGLHVGAIVTADDGIPTRKGFTWDCNVEVVQGFVLAEPWTIAYLTAACAA